MERWVYVGAGITAASGAAAYALLPVTGMANAPTFLVSPLWLSLTATVAACHLFWQIIKLMVKGQPNPTATILAGIDWRQAKTVIIGTVLLALNLTFFCMIKPQLGQLVDFWADPLLADIDHWVFGADPWRLILWFDHPGMPNLYHRGWFFWLAFVAFYLLRRPDSPEKDRLIISYLLMWSVGPLVHLLMPAAGPVFFDDLGFGDRFADLRQDRYTSGAAYYLWDGYVNRTFHPAGGISAMPSLHLATMFWSIIAVRNTRWFAFAIFFTAYIFLGSIATGWHYAVDGIAGGLVALFCYFAASVLLKSPHRTLARLGPIFGRSVAADATPG